MSKVSKIYLSIRSNHKSTNPVCYEFFPPILLEIRHDSFQLLRKKKLWPIRIFFSVKKILWNKNQDSLFDKMFWLVIRLVKKSSKDSPKVHPNHTLSLEPHKNGEKMNMVFCYQNCSDLLWQKNCSSDREKLLKFEVEGQEFWDP